MKRVIQIFVIGILLHFFGPASGQGWERVYPLGAFRNVLSLPDGDMIIIGSDTYRMAADGNLTWTLDYTLAPATINGWAVTEWLTPKKAVLSENGSVTQMATIRPGFQEPFPQKVALYQASEDGELLWEDQFDLTPNDSLYADALDLEEAADGGYYVLSIMSDEVSGPLLSYLVDPDIVLAKTDSLGQLEWMRSYPRMPGQPGNILAAYDLQVLPNGHVVAMARDFILETDADGNEVNRITIGLSGSSGTFTPFRMISLPDSTYLLFGHQQTIVNNTEAVTYSVVARMDAGGQLLWQTVLDDEVFCQSSEFMLSQNGHILALSYTIGPLGLSGILLHALDLDGAKLWWRHFSWPFTQTPGGLCQAPDGSILIAGQRRLFNPITSTFSNNGYLLKLDSLGRIYGSLAQGNIFEDLDGDCDTLPEAPLGGWLVELSGQQDYYGITDSLGYYNIPVDTGSYTARAIAPSEYWQACTPEVPMHISLADTLGANFPMQAAVECPSLQVDVSAPFLRRCFPSTYTVSYCNTGTVPATDAYVEVELDPYLNYQFATLPLAGQAGNTLSFQLGQVDVGECGRFYITVQVDCDSTVLGQTHCTTAHIYPDSICTPSPNWSGASIEVDGNCTGDSLQFTIKNVGTAPTTGPLEYIVIEDQVVLRQGIFDLQPNETEWISLPATGATVRLEAQQEPFHPGNSMPTVTVEGCGLQAGDFSLGYTTQYWEDDGDAFISIDCQENIGAFDPNDKRAFPKGYGPEHYIEPGTEIEYHIRFQNTGTDTAFTVIIEDPLDSALDLTSVRPGASSHSYRFEIKPGRLLSFRFENILLPDSTANEPASHGFVKFRVTQQPDLPDGAQIHNTAAIFFDFNEAIITNTTLHTIGRDFIPPAEFVPDEWEEWPIEVYPNPFEEKAQVRIDGYNNIEPLGLELYDSTGRLVRKEQHGSASFTFWRRNMPKGIYFYRISERGVAVNTGKIVIQ
ncbi:MAG: T9SS type A sorting domain-containing protein [Phaeodactylibacter sp.]|nr:T9SS type A sorting domain-containing protein [Phaeodactylibacter sp.]